MKKNQNEKELIKILDKRNSKLRWMGFPTLGGKKDWASFKIIDYLIHRQSNNRHKYFVIDLIKPSWRRTPELRFGYYIIGKKASARGKWKWGQYCPLIPPKDLKALFKKVKKRGWLRVRSKIKNNQNLPIIR